MSDWTDLDLPLPEVPAYGYSVDAGLQRTPFTTAKPRQRRKYETNRRNFAVEVLLTQAQLAIAESFIQCYGYTWFTMPLLSGQDEVDVVSDHSVRLTENYQISTVGWNLYKLSMRLEDRFVEPEPACQWCSIPAAYTTWNAEEGAWSYYNFWGGGHQILRPVAVEGVEWWRGYQPATLTLSLYFTGLEEEIDNWFEIRIHTDISVVATIDISELAFDTWHTLTVPLEWSNDPTGELAYIQVESFIYVASTMLLKICQDDTGQECTGY